ncbi:hypothetical protein BDFB_015031 [Asbolus verrucosus]|uniref:Mutator-like transposase domain-containing protein n=1 Tax=Asbolus verrucosus TaxID=1661398 RepID=A0A482VVX2_ASBVE|nr:hypothetical protein BDFB_015031 [Asbolus verrucosus]
MCGKEGSFTTDNDIDLGVNKAAVCGTIGAETRYSQLNDFCAGLDIPMISEKTYVVCQNQIMDNAKI